MLTAPLLFTVKGTPRPQPRPRFVKGRVISTASRAVKFWRLMVEREARIAIGECARDGGAYFAGPVLLSLTFIFMTPANEPQRLGTPHTHRPDADNLAKGVMDALQAAGVFGDDAAVAGLVTSKVWGAGTGCVVRIDPIIDAMAGLRAAGGIIENGGHQSPPDWLAGSGGVLRDSSLRMKNSRSAS